MREGVAVPMGRLTVYWYKDVQSTNQTAFDLARQGAPDFTLVVAERQHGGKGRMGRSFFSPPGGLYMTLVLPLPSFPVGRLTTLAAVRMAENIQTLFGRRIDVKWVNDLMCDGRKVGGILAEARQMNGRTVVALGVGVNVAEQEFPAELRNKAASLLSGQAARENCLRLALLFAQSMEESLRGAGDVLAAYRQRCITLGRQVQCTVNGQAVFGTAVDITEDGELVVQTETGRQVIRSGEASIRLSDGTYA